MQLLIEKLIEYRLFFQKASFHFPPGIQTQDLELWIQILHEQTGKIADLVIQTSRSPFLLRILYPEDLLEIIQVWNFNGLENT